MRGRAAIVVGVLAGAACRNDRSRPVRQPFIETMATTSSVAALPPAPPAIAQIAAGGATTCARTTSGDVLCWGANDFGQLARSTTKGCGQNDADCDPVPAPAPALHDIVGLALGTWHGCAVRRDRGLVCWGRNDQTQLGFETRTCPGGPCAPIPKSVPLPPVVEVAASWRQTCARLADGRVACWGQDDYGQLGVRPTRVCGGYPCVPVPGIIDELTNVAGIALGHAHTCARLATGTVSCFGGNEHGQLGADLLAPPGTCVGGPCRSTPVTVAGLTDVVEIALGDDHSCARTRSGDVSCWGHNGEGQLGDGSRDDRHAPVRVKIPPATRIVAGTSHTCALVRDGAVFCWGSEDALGRGLGSDSPVAVPALSGVVEIAAGFAHTCARTERAVWCWGANEQGQLGDGTTLDRSKPATVRW